ncbi:TetR/AcrR family transcriptional regulator [Actinorhabdospora filicis]|nr:TetR/AcrR family transcriptional regulator [Actinorhabdospora filicis]
MGNRENLLEGARACLLDKGFVRTTARDIATAAGVSLAAIGYHFGSKEALLEEALIGALKDWGDELEAIAAAGHPAAPRERFASVWDRVIASIAASPAMWAVQFELLAEASRDPERAASLAGANQGARSALAALLGLPDSAGAMAQMLLLGAASRILLDPADLTPGGELLDEAAALLSALV